MNKLCEIANVSDAQERAESINARKLTNQVTRVIRIHNRGCGRCKTQTSTTHYMGYQRKILFYNSGKEMASALNVTIILKQ